MLNIKLANPNCLPKVGTAGSAGMDLRVCCETHAGYRQVNPGQSFSCSTGVSIEIPVGWVGLVMPRSGLGTKYRVVLDNTIGVIDSDYRGEIHINITVQGTKPMIIEDYQRICQMVILPHYDVSQLNVVEELSITGRGTKGFGSTGVA